MQKERAVTYRRVFRDDFVHVQRRMCDTCIFRPGNLMHLEPGRVESMVRDCGDESIIPCHEVMDTAAPGVCKGFFTKHRNRLLQIAYRLKKVRYQ